MWSHSDEYEIQFEEQMPDTQQEKANDSTFLLQDGWDGGGVWDQAQSYVNAVYEHATPYYSTNNQGLTFFSSLRHAIPVEPSTNLLESSTSIEKSPSAQQSSLYEKLMKAMNEDQINVTGVFTRTVIKCETNNDLLNCASAVMQYFFDRLKHKKSLYDGVTSQQVGSLLLERTGILDKLNEKLKDIKVSVAVRKDKSLNSETGETSSDLTVSETQTSASTILECSGGAETDDSIYGDLEAFLMDEQVNDSNSIYEELEKRLMGDSAEQPSPVRSP